MKLTGLCYVCLKPCERNELGFTRFTHPRCAPGTSKWCDWFKRMKRTTAAGLLIYHHANIRKGTVKQ